MSAKSTRPLIIEQIRRIITRHWSKFLVLGLWILIIAVYWRVAQDVAPTLEDKIHLVADWFLVDGWGPLLFLAVFALQPLVFFPSFIMSIIAGLLYGPIFGMCLSVVGLACAANVTYGAGLLLGGDAAQAMKSNRWVRSYFEQLQTRTFETLLTLNLLYVPFDLLNYIAGFMRLKWRRFAAATFLGTLPSGLAYVLFGNSLGSLDQVAKGQPQINMPLLILSLVLAVGAYVFTRYWGRSNRKAKNGSPNGAVPHPEIPS